MKNSLENVIDQYEQLWRDGDRPPMLGQFLADSLLSMEQRNAVLADLVAIDMEYRWRAAAPDQSLRATTPVIGALAADEETIADTIGARPTLEKYLREWPELAQSTSIRSELPAEEFRVRHRWGDRPSIDEFLKRFDGEEHLRAELSKVLDELDRDEAGADKTQDAIEVMMISTGGESFGRYRLIRQLGKGGMGQVYLAEDTQLERHVALKIPHLGESEVVRKRFVNEAKAAAMLHHPNICPVFDAGEIDGQPFLTMAYIEGMTLRDIWQHDGKPDVDEIATHFATIAEAMQAAHDAGIVHRDLKPSNVMIHREGHPVVMDFGLAFRGAAADERLTQTGDAFGSPAYMSPEQIEGDYTSVGPASDIYSLGVMLYEALTGSLPFTGTASLLAVRIARDEPQRPSVLCRDCPETLERLCMRMLAKQPAARPTSMSEVAAAFREFARRQRQGEPARPNSVAKQSSDQRRRVNFAAALVALAVVGLLAAALVIKVQTDRGEVVIKSFDPDIEVLVKRNGEAVDEITLDNDPVSTKVRTGEISIEVKGVDPDGVRIKNGKFELTKGERVVVEILPARLADGDIVNNHQGPSSLDQLRRDNITPYQRKVAGGGDPSKAPAELVAVLGDSRLQHEHRAAADVRFTSDGETLVSGGEDGKIRFWDVESGELVREIQTSWRIVQIALSPNQQQVAALFDLGGKCASATFDVATGREKHRIDSVSCNLHGMDWLDDQHVICLDDGRDGQLTVRNVATGDTLRTFAASPDGFPLVSLSPDRKHLAVALRHPIEDAFRVALFATETGDRLHELSNTSFTNQQISGIAWHPSAQSLVIVEGGRPFHWDIESGSIDSLDQLAWGAAWAPDGQLLAMANAEAVDLWRPDRKAKTGRLPCPVKPMAMTLRYS
ncbi:MAG: protein kinase, partial [Planctomycetales bacterium]|nr:protein kinase [Planctomycetales bacterium]